MAGDHKCPVCQATFTRPQHVARHMRSHTGDRPYKCQHCGDQFARSDLLSRHVNKCHAGDKPPTTTAPTRRKGASSTRATTSKQACDQCVIATLPCDGANPCSKCIQHKGPCTYVKFQRQTAPVGPGHRHSQSVDSTTTSSMSSFIGSVPRPDELFMAGPPPMTVPSMGVSAGDLFYPGQFAFNAPSGAPPWDSDSSNTPALSFSGTDSGGDSDQARFRESDMLRGASLAQPGYTQAIAGGAGPTLNPNPYYSLQQQQQQTVAPTDAWQFSTDFRLPSQRKMDEGFAQYLPSSSSAQLGGTSAMVNPANLDFNGGGGLYNLHTRRSSVDDYSDGSGLSAPNSAASSSTHLPLDFGSSDQVQGGQQIQPLNLLYQFDENQQPPPSREGRVASSFGLMSLADGDQSFIGNFNDTNNNLNVDGTAPFFTQHAMKLPPQDSTPRPFRNDENRAGQSPRDKEAEMRELKEFWKQYLRTPLTGPSLGATPKAELINNQLGAFGDGSRPTPKRGLSRVASLPSVRTPPDEKVSVVPSRVTNSHSQSHAQLPMIQTNDDLKSYEQAVLARKPLNLTFVPRKGRHSISSSASPQPPPQQLQTQSCVAKDVASANPGLFPRAGPLAALSSMDGGNSSDDNPGPGDTSLRPSFKRLASQTLENTTQKRTMFRWGEPDDVIDDSESDVDGPSDAGSPPNRFDASNPGLRTSSMSPTSYHRNMQFAHAGIGGTGSGAETLLDRFRRQSAPSGIRPNLTGMDTANGKMMESSPSPVSYSASPLQTSHTVDNFQVTAPQSGLSGVDSNTLVQT